MDEGGVAVISPQEDVSTNDQSASIRILSDNNNQQPQSLEEEAIDFVFLCKIDNARVVSNILSALHSNAKKEGQIATVTVTKTGIKFTVEEIKGLQGNAFLQEEIFQEYKLKDESECFRINLSIMLDCLGIYGGGTSFVALQMAYGGYGNQLLLMLEEGGVVTNCGLKTLEPEIISHFNFRGSPIPNKIIMEAEYLKDAFNELDWSSTHVNIHISPDPPYFRLSTAGPSGSCQVDYPKDSEVFEAYECDAEISFTYKLSNLQPAVKALNISTKTQLRINQIGILSLQHLIKNEDKNISFVDFFIAPEESSQDDD